MGGVLSQAEGFTSVAGLWPALAFHTVCMLGGMACLERASRRAKAAVAH